MSEEQTKEFKVCALMTLGRYRNTRAQLVIEQAIRSVGLPLHTAEGVFYGQCMQRLFTRAIDQGIDVAITIDWDSFITGKHIMQLLQIMAQRPDIDALAAMQAKRGCHYPLMTIQGQTSTDWDGRSPLQVDTMHFGCTAIRLDKLAKMPKPWFWSTPGTDGEWEDDSGKIDDDIYFWKSWKAAGNSAYVDPLTRIGHMEETIAVFDDSMKVRHLYPKAWSELIETGKFPSDANTVEAASDV